MLLVNEELVICQSDAPGIVVVDERQPGYLTGVRLAEEEVESASFS